MKSSVYLTDEEEQQLKELAEKLERSSSWIIRKAISEFAKSVKAKEKPAYETA